MSVSQRALWFVAATPTVNQVYISESMLSKGVQLLFKTATFYFIFIPGLSLLFLACHIATHLHKSFWEKGWRGEEVGKSRRGGEEGTQWRVPSAIAPQQLRRNNNNQGTTTAAGRTTQASIEQGKALHFQCFVCLLFCPCLDKWSKSVIREPRFVPRDKDDMV